MTISDEEEAHIEAGGFWARESAKQAELRDVRDKYWGLWQSLTADMNAEIRDIERRYAFERAA